MKLPKKFSDTSIRVLKTLKILVNSASSIQDVIAHFEKTEPDNRTYTNEVILKYINTMKVFGFKFTKNRDKYVLLNSPCKFDFSEDDLKMINMIEQLTWLIPEEKVKDEIGDFLQELEKGFSDSTKEIANKITLAKIKNLGVDYEKYVKQVQEYEKYCIEGQKLKIKYKDFQNMEISILVEPNEIKYLKNKVFLNVYNPVSAQILDINFDDIIEIQQLPLKSNPSSMLSTVTFKLKGNLAKGYTLHDGEKLLNTENDGSIVIVNRHEDGIQLTKRLMRYGFNCEIISPKKLREEIASIVNKALAHY